MNNVCVHVFIYFDFLNQIVDVAVSEKPINLANTMSNLPLHSDLVMYESPPGILMLHSIKFVGNIHACSYRTGMAYFYPCRNDVIGGESLLLDTFPVLEEMRIKHPDEFHTLTRIPATFQRIHFDR